MSITLLLSLLLGAVLGVQSSTTVTTAAQVEVRLGDDAVLPCDYSPPTSGQNNILASLTWSKPNESTTAVSTVASYICSSPTSCTLAALNNGKYVLDVDRTSQGPLTVTQVTLADDGRYTCEVTALVGNGQSSTYLTVTIPPSAQILTDAAANTTGYRTGTTVQVTAGVPHTFTCTIKGARPAAVARWSIETIGIQADNITTRHHKEGKLEDTISEFTFLPEKSHGGKFVWCIVSDEHPALDQQMITSVVLDVNVPPGEVILWDTQNRPISANGQQFNANQNKNHTFHCRTAGTKPAATIEWYLNDEQITTGVVHNDPEVQSENAELFDTQSALNILIEQKYHMENLECRVTAAGVTITRYLELLVTGPPDDPEIQTGGQLTEDVQAHLVCIANNAYPAPSLRWYNDDRDISDQANTHLTKNSNGRFDAISTLTFDPTRKDNQHFIKCLVQHESLSEPFPVDELKINVDFCPNSVSLTCPDSIVSGQYAVVTCRSASSNPRTGFSWTIGGEEINPTGSRRYDTDENSGETTTQSHVGTYNKRHNRAEVQCCGSVKTASSPLTCSDDICDRCTLDVRYPAELGRPRKTPSEPVEEGTELVLSIPAEGNPAPTVVWKKNGSPEELPSVYENSMSKVTIDKVSRDMAGSYYCTSSNSIGDAVESISIDVVVHFPPTIVTENGKTSANEGQTASLRCEVNANPRPTITWYKPDSIQMVESDRVTITEKVVKSPYSNAFRIISQLQIRNIVFDDYGEYDCRVSNNVGVDDFNITLTGKTKPEPPYELMASTLTATSVTLTWQPGFSGGEKQWFVISYRSKETSSIIQIPDEIHDKQYTIDGLDPYQEYTFTVCSSNTLGKSEGGPAITVTTLPESPGLAAAIKDGPVAQTWCNFHGYDIEYNQETGRVFLKPSDAEVPADLCIKVETNADGNGWNEVPGCLNDKEYVDVDPQLENRQIRTVTCGKSKPYCSQDGELRFVTNPHSGNNSMGILVGSVIGGIFLLITIIILLVFLIRTGNSKHVKGPKTMENGQAGYVRKPPAMQCAATATTEPNPNPEPNGPTDTKMVALNEEERKSFLPDPGEGNLYENTTFGPTSSSVIASAPPQSPTDAAPPETVLYENTKMMGKPCRASIDDDDDDDDDDDVDSGGDALYDDIDPADCIKNGRSMNADGLIYATVEHKNAHPSGAPPIQTEPSTDYASLDFRKM